MGGVSFVKALVWGIMLHKTGGPAIRLYNKKRNNA